MIAHFSEQSPKDLAVKSSLSIESEVPKVAFPSCTQRSLTYYLDCARHFLAQKETLTEAAEGTKEARKAWNEFKARSGQVSFIGHCLQMLKQWEALDGALQSELLGVPVPTYLPCSAALNLLKVPNDNFSGCLARLKELVGEQGYLLPKDVTAIAKLFHIKRVTYLVLEEEMTEEGWTLIAKKYKLNLEELAAIQQLAQQLASSRSESVFTDHAIEALSLKEYDTTRILPKPKKKYTDRDLKRVVEPLEAENAELKQQIQELKEGAIVTRFTVPERVGEGYEEATAQLILDPENSEDSEETPAETPRTEEVEKETRYVGSTEDAAGSPDVRSVVKCHRIEHLEEHRARFIDHNGLEKQGIFKGQKGTSHRGQIMDEDQKIHIPKFEQIELEYPYDSGEYHVLSKFIKNHHLKLKKLESFSDLVPA